MGLLRYLKTVARARRSGTADYFAREERKRSRPSITNAAWIPLRSRHKIVAPWLSDVPPDAVVLDVGGAIQPYRQHLLGGQRYIGLDLQRTPRVDVMADSVQLPIKSESVDVVLCTQVLQYADDQTHAIREIHRVLKPGGIAILGVASRVPRFVHGPKDRRRPDPSELYEALALFGSVEIVPECTEFATRLLLMLHRLEQTRLRLGFGMKPLIIVFNLLAIVAKSASLNGNFSLTYAVRAVKSRSTSQA